MKRASAEEIGGSICQGQRRRHARLALSLFGKMYVLAVHPSPPNPMGSVSDDWVQDGFVDPLGCIMSIVTQSTPVKKRRHVVFVEYLTPKDSAL